MLKELTPELKEAIDLGITLYAGEAEEQFGSFLQDVHAGKAKPLYNYMHDLPNLQSQTIPYLPQRLVKRYDGVLSSFDAGRGCPFQCSFCTIINVQGRKSRWRDADDIERIIRENAAQGITRFFVTDDNFARNKNWEPIFDRLIELREREGMHIAFLIQVDTLAHQIPNFISKASRAGCTYAFIGLESINPDNLVHMKKNQNRITEYRKMFQAWKEAGIVTYAGFIMGLPGDTPASIKRDVEIIQSELAVDVLEFTVLTPLPGSEDHQTLFNKGVWMDPDLNKYDIENVTTGASEDDAPRSGSRPISTCGTGTIPTSTSARLMQRNIAYGIKPVKIWRLVLQIYGAMKFENVHPQQCGYFRLKDRDAAAAGAAARSRAPLLSAIRVGDARQIRGLRRLRLEDQPHPQAAREGSGEQALYATSPSRRSSMRRAEHTEMFELNDSSRAAVEKARKQAEQRRLRARKAHTHDDEPVQIEAAE